MISHVNRLRGLPDQEIWYQEVHRLRGDVDWSWGHAACIEATLEDAHPGA